MERKEAQEIVLEIGGKGMAKNEPVYEDKIIRYGNPEDKKILGEISGNMAAYHGRTLHDFRHYIVTLKNGTPVAILCYNIVRHKKHQGKPIAQVELHNLDAQPHAARLIDKMREIHPDLEMVYGRATPSAIKAAKRYAEANKLKIKIQAIKGRTQEIITPGTKDVFMHLPKPRALNIRRVR